MSEKPEALADRLDDERMNLIERLADENERLADENERLREALTYDWDQLEACRESLREHMVEIKRLRDELKEDTGVIAVWRGRTERAESENERLREALDNLISACELPGDHCEVEQALPHAKAALRREYV